MQSKVSKVYPFKAGRLGCAGMKASLHSEICLRKQKVHCFRSSQNRAINHCYFFVFTCRVKAYILARAVCLFCVLRATYFSSMTLILKMFMCQSAFSFRVATDYHNLLRKHVKELVSPGVGAPASNPALERLRRSDCHGCKVSLGYRARLFLKHYRGSS